VDRWRLYNDDDVDDADEDDNVDDEGVVGRQIDEDDGIVILTDDRS
jgi:hypothetical protein